MRARVLRFAPVRVAEFETAVEQHGIIAVEL
jgi:hypothetical protein